MRALRWKSVPKIRCAVCGEWIPYIHATGFVEACVCRSDCRNRRAR